MGWDEMVKEIDIYFTLKEVLRSVYYLRYVILTS